MRWLCRVNNVPAIIIEHFALFVGKPTLRVIQNQPGAQWGKGGIDMNWIGITRKIHRMYAMFRKMPPDPFNAFKIGCKPMLHHQITAFEKNGINEVVVIRGYKRGTVMAPGVRYVDNVEYATNNILMSLFCAGPELVGDVVVSYGDIIYPPTF